MTRRALVWLRLLTGAGILAALVWRVGGDAFTDALQVIDGRAVLAALAIGLLSTLAAAWRWCLVVRRLGLTLSPWTALADYYRAQFLNTVLPGGVLGDVHRAVGHGRSNGDVGRGVRAVVIERLGGQIVLLVLGVSVLLTQPAVISAARHSVTAADAAVACLAAVALVAAVRWGRRTAIWRRMATPVLTDLRAGLFARDTWPGVMSLSTAALAGHLALFLVAARVVGCPAPVTRLLPLLVLALFAMGLPINIGGWGPREGVSAWAFAAAGLGAGQGVTIAVVYGVLTFVSSLPGAAVLVHRHITRPRPEVGQIQLEERVLPEPEPANGRA